MPGKESIAMLSQQQINAMAIVGKISLPAPVPAAGRVILGVGPGLLAAQRGAPPSKHYVRLELAVSSKATFEMLLNHADVHAISVPASNDEPPDAPPTLIHGPELDNLLKAKIAALGEVAGTELELFAKANIFADETAATLLRTSLITTASEASARAIEVPPVCNPCTVPGGFRDPPMVMTTASPQDLPSCNPCTVPGGCGC